MQVVRSFYGVLFLFFLLFTSNQSLAQDTKNPKEVGKNDSSETKLRISIPISSLPKGELKIDQFKATENGVSQVIDSLKNPDQSISYGLIIDTSGSMRPRLPDLKILGISLINHLSEKDEMAIASLKIEAELIHKLSSSKVFLTDALNELYTGGGTSLFDGITVVSEYLKKASTKRAQDYHRSHRRRRRKKHC